jgi:3-phosphoshikimate 1-carboxyvinyltransferase
MHRLLPRAKRPLDARVVAPASKSVTHRALVAAALAEGTSTLVRPLDAADTRATVTGLRAIGITVTASGGELQVEGCGGSVPGGGNLDLAESGTSLRFLTAVAAIGTRPSRIDGCARLRERPIRPLVDALAVLGADVSPDRLPLTVGGTLFGGGKVSVAASRSSQFASALMSIGPCLRDGLRVQLLPPVVSRPYLELTAEVMGAFGANVCAVGDSEWQVGTAPYRARSFTVEGDHSSASYFLAAPLIASGCVRVERLNPRSRQADACFAQIIERLGGQVSYGENWIEVNGSGELAPFDVSLAHAPDLVPTLAVLGLFADGPSVIRDVAHLRVKESDRLDQLAFNLRQLGRAAETREDRLLIGGHHAPESEPIIETGGDHRIAMAFALAGLRLSGLRVDNDTCVAKSNPNFWKDWERMLGAS